MTAYVPRYKAELAVIAAICALHWGAPLPSTDRLAEALERARNP